MRAVLINTTDEIGHHGCTLVNRQIDHYCNQVGINIVERLSLNQDWDNVADFDMALVNGEGSLHSSSKAAKRIIQVPEWAHKRKKKAVLINSIYQNNDDAIDHEVKKFDFISVRDRYSQEKLKKLGLDAMFVPDITLTWNIEPATLGAELLYNGSTRKQTRQRLYDLAKGHKATYLPILARPQKNAKRLRKFYLKQFLSYLTPSGLWRSRNRNAIAELDDFVAFLGSSKKGLVSGCFHMITMAACLEIPFLAVSSNTYKIEAQLDDLDLTNRLVDISSLENKNHASPAPFTNAEIENIRRYRSKTKKLADECFQKIRLL